MRGYLTEFVRCYRGPYAFLAWAITVEAVAATAFLVCLIVGLFDAETTRDQILFAVGVLGVGMVIVLIKVFFWMLMHRQALEARLDKLERQSPS